VVFVEPTAEQPAADVHPFFLLDQNELSRAKVS
jgi:hypothetical protein